MPAPFHGPESLSDHIRDLANAFSSAAGVLSQQYTDLNKATKGLLDGTYSWKGKSSDAFFTVWQSFGKYIQAMQKSCQDIHNSLIKFASKLDDIEAQEGWDALLTVMGGILTIVSAAAAIAEFGLNPFVDGFTAFIGTFTEQEGSDIVNVAEDISQADSEAASELSQIEEEISSSPALTGPAPETPGSLPDVLSPTNLDEMTLNAYNDVTRMTSAEWNQWIEDYTFDYDPTGNLDGINAPNACAPSAAKMLLEDNGIAATDQQIENALGYNPADGTSPNNLANGLRQLGLPNANYDPNMTLTELQNETGAGRPVIVGLNLGTNPTAPNEGHAVIVDGFEDTSLGEMVLIRDPFFSPPHAYMMPMWAFQQVWQYGGLTY